MIRSHLLRAFTLLCFITLLAAFTLYRGGYLDHYFEVNSTGPATSNLTNDTVPKKKDSLPPTLLPSSKSAYVVRDFKPFSQDSAKNADSIRWKKMATRRMSSSKSGAIFEPVATTADTTKQKAKSQSAKKNQ